MSTAGHLKVLNYAVLTQGPKPKEAPINVIVHHHHVSKKEPESSPISSYCCYLEVACVNSTQISLAKTSHSTTLTSGG